MRLSKEQLDETIAILKQRYSNKPAKTISELVGANRDLEIGSLNTATRMYYGETRKDFLIKQGILQGGFREPTISDNNTEKQRLEKRNKLNEELEWLLINLCKSYENRKVPKTLDELIKENESMPVARINNYTVNYKGEKLISAIEKYVNKTNSNFYDGINITEPPSKGNKAEPVDISKKKDVTDECDDQHEMKENEASGQFDYGIYYGLPDSQKVEMIMSTLKERYQKKKKVSYIRLMADNQDIPLLGLNKLTQFVWNIRDIDYLKGKGIIE